MCALVRTQSVSSVLYVNGFLDSPT